IWGAMIFAALAAGGTVATLFMDPTQLGLPTDASQDAMLDAAGFVLPEISFMVFVWFLLFFLGGYLFYASLFAAVGSAVEQQQDAQSLLIPITMPIIIGFVFIPFLIENPNGILAVVLSLIPLFSPILMVVRLAVTSVPVWEVFLSFAILVASFVGAIWISARIYRIGILMYGKKATLRDLARWVGQG
ncbi:MAG: ABC transporter permease, partial [Bacteroidota bacterium]